LISRGRIQQQLARRIAPGIRQGIDFASADFAGKRQHGTQDFPQRRAIIRGDPAAERQKGCIQHGLFVNQFQCFAHLLFGSVAVRGEHHTG
jgi:hypothetical protein